MELDEIDGIGLIREAYRIEGIGAAECRSIFMEWALRLPPGIPPRDAIERLLRAHAAGREGHPMTAVLREGLIAPDGPRRRGGRKSRRN